MTNVFDHTELDLLKSIGFKIGDSGYFELEKGSIYTMVVKGSNANPFIYLYETRIDFYGDYPGYEETLSKTLWDYKKESLKEFFDRTLAHIG